MNSSYKPEGSLLRTQENRELTASPAGLERAMNNGTILECVANLCDSEACLHFDLHGVEGIMRREDAVYCRGGESVKDIAVITRVGKPVCFIVKEMQSRGGKPTAILSRRDAQEECLAHYIEGLRPGDIVPGRVTHLENFGAFVDIGCGVTSLLSVDSISVSRISHPRDRLRCGEDIFAVVKMVDNDLHRLFLSTRELLGTWEENAAAFAPGSTVAGVVRSVEPYGIFVELAPNLAGLAEWKEGTTIDADALIGKTVAVYIKSILPERMKVKLVLIDAYPGESEIPDLRYYIDGAAVHHLDGWRYSPVNAPKVVESVF